MPFSRFPFPPQRGDSSNVFLTGEEEWYVQDVLPNGAAGRSPEQMLETLPGVKRSPKLMDQLNAAASHRGPTLRVFQPGARVSGRPAAPRMGSPYVNAVTEGKVTSTPDFRKLFNVPGQRYSVAVAGLHESHEPAAAADRSTRGNRYQDLPPNLTESLQMALLLLPTKNRRILQLLVRMMYKLSNNLAAHLDGESGENNAKIVMAALQPIIMPEYPWLVRVLVYRHVTVFAIPFALGLRVDAEFKWAVESFERTATSKVPQMTTSDSDETDCQLMELLETYVNDENMSQKEKKKRLLKFKSCHPSVFEKKFPRAVDFERLFLEKPKLRSRFNFPIRF